MKELFNLISIYKKEISKLENTPQKFKAIEMLEILLEKARNNNELALFLRNNLKGTVKLRNTLKEYALYNEDDLIHFNAMIIIDNINYDK